MIATLPRLATLLAILLGVYHLYTAVLGAPVALVHRAIHLGGMTMLAYLMIAASERTSRAGRVAALATGILGTAAALYLIVSFRDLMTRVGALSPLDLVMATLAVLVVMDLARQMHGWALTITTSAFVVYGVAGPWIPGFMGHRGYALPEILEFLYTTTEGLFGVPLQVSATYIAVFILFAAFLERSGIIGLFHDLAFALAGRSAGGVAKVAVVSSALMGTVNGSGLANVTTTGAVTIPLMKQSGFAPHYAAAVEATASMGGQIMPPVMGVAAFLMAERLGVPYTRIALAAIVPALLYFFATGVQIHLHAKRHGLVPPPDSKARRLGDVLRRDGYLLLPVLALFVVMLQGYSPVYAAVGSIAASLLLSWAASLVVALGTPGDGATRLAAFRAAADARGASLTGILGSLDAGMRRTVSVAAACAVVGIIIGIVTLTGAGLKLSSAIIMAAGERLPATLVLTMFACFLLGMGLPTIPTYIITSTMAAPALLKLGVDPLAADFFVMYFGVLANLTPPVALAAYAAAGIAGASPLRTSIQGIQLSVAGFLVPYIFVYSPIMLGVGFEPWEMLGVTVTATAGVFALGAAMEGYLFRVTTWYERVLLLAAALVLIVPGVFTDAIGAVLFAVIVVSQRRRPVLPATVSTQAESA
ncbi:MAG: TRAP transporter fused permease subunit [Vicinamibacterales bacterium]|nr:TRAP transporter fused permease subunit [Vicinamibacterales bacterium]